MTAFAVVGIDCFDDYEGLGFTITALHTKGTFKYTIYHKATGSKLVKGSGYISQSEAVEAAKDEINRMNTNYYLA